MAYQHGLSVTFMAKPDHTWVGSSCHIHSSLWQDGKAAFAGESDVFKHYLAGQIACAARAGDLRRADDQLVQALRRGSWAPTTLAWGYDNRTCGFRIVGHGASLRAETRIPGADANPYLAFSALHRLRAVRDRDTSSSSGPRSRATRTSPTSSASRPSLRYAIHELEQGTMARQAFGDEVVDHYLIYARTEQRLFDEVVTGYERERLFERG